jgi:hypothetical protein
MYTSHAGEIYRGEFLLGKRNGCAAAATPLSLSCLLSCRLHALCTCCRELSAKLAFGPQQVWA